MQSTRNGKAVHVSEHTGWPEIRTNRTRQSSGYLKRQVAVEPELVREFQPGGWDFFIHTKPRKENPMEQITLYYRSGASDKVYQASIQPAGGGFIVAFAYGRRGPTPQTGTKTHAPVAY